MLATASTEAVRAEESGRSAVGGLHTFGVTQRCRSLIAFVSDPKRTFILGRSGR